MNKPISLPQLEYNYVKLHALYILCGGMLLLSDPIFNLVNQLFTGQTWALPLMAIVYAPLLIGVIYLLFNVLRDGLTLKIKIFKNKEHYQDEFSLHIKNKASDYALGCGVVSASFFIFLPHEYVVMIYDDMARIILSSIFLGYAIPALIFLREDNE